MEIRRTTGPEISWQEYYNYNRKAVTAMKKYNTDTSKVLHDAAKKYVVNGAGSSFHIPSYRSYPICMECGAGSKLYDVDGNEYIDYVAGFGPMLLGYCPKAVDQAVRDQLNLGTHFAAPNKGMALLARKLVEIIPCAQRVSFQNSGSEVVMYALRLARAYTGRYKVIKFEGQYHGWSDEEKISIDANRLEELGDRKNPNKIIHSKGQRLSSADDLIVLPWNDLQAVEEVILLYQDEIAAIIMEPIMCDSGPIFPATGYLEGIRALTRQHDIVLIFDEVITGFRCALGGAQQYYGVTPDLSTFAKAISSGYPFGVVAGRQEIMECGIQASGTFNGNPIGAAAALATIEELQRPGTYEQLQEIGDLLTEGFLALGDKYKIKVFAKAIGAIFSLYFGYDHNPEDFRDWLTKADVKLYQKFISGCESYGVRFTDRRGRQYLSTAHTREDVRKTLEVADQVLSEIL